MGIGNDNIVTLLSKKKSLGELLVILIIEKNEKEIVSYISSKLERFYISHFLHL